MLFLLSWKEPRAKILITFNAFPDEKYAAENWSWDLFFEPVPEIIIIIIIIIIYGASRDDIEL